MKRFTDTLRNSEGYSMKKGVQKTKYYWKMAFNHKWLIENKSSMIIFTNNYSFY